jgi:NADPH-dependent 2,4-dienoyl-CoA reductase/sulfur reductase-like enzyme
MTSTSKASRVDRAAAENLTRRGLAVTLVELGGQALAPLDGEMVAPVHAALSANGVDLRLGVGVAKVLPDAVELTDRNLIDADLVLLAIGVRPATELARNARPTARSWARRRSVATASTNASTCSPPPCGPA